MTRKSLCLRAAPLVPIGGLAALVVGASVAWAAGEPGVTILTGPARSAVAEVFGPRLAQMLEPAMVGELQSTSGSWETLEAVAANPAMVGFAQEDLFQRFVAERGLEGELESYGSIPVCLFAAARTGSPVTLGLGSSAPAAQIQTVDTGPADGDTARTYQILQERVPALQELAVEHRGWSRALARVAEGDLDLLVFVEYPHAESPLVADVFDNPRLHMLANVVEVLGLLPVADMAPYRATQASIPRGGWFDDRYVGQTLCTSLGIVIHRDGDPQVVEAVVHAATGGELLNAMEGSWWQSVTGQLVDLLDQGRRWTISVLNDL
jgi:hypothetical protein